jgi:hypothetical protein
MLSSLNRQERLGYRSIIGQDFDVGARQQTDYYATIRYSIELLNNRQSSTSSVCEARAASTSGAACAGKMTRNTLSAKLRCQHRPCGQEERYTFTQA